MKTEDDRSAGSRGSRGRKRARPVRRRSSNKAPVSRTPSKGAPVAHGTTDHSRRTRQSAKEGGADAAGMHEHASGGLLSKAPSAQRGSRTKMSKRDCSSKRSSSRTAAVTAALGAVGSLLRHEPSKDEPSKAKQRRKPDSVKGVANDLAAPDAATKVSPPGPPDTRDSSAETAASMSVGTSVPKRGRRDRAASARKGGHAGGTGSLPSLRALRLFRRRSSRKKGRAKDGGRESRPMSAATSITHPVSHDGTHANESTPPWSSFFPLNVTFLTEVNTAEMRFVFAAWVFMCGLMLAVVVVSLVLVLYTKRHASPLACVTAECAAAREYLRQLLNTSKDVCRDFYDYVCDSWLRRGRQGGSFLWDSVVASLVAINESLLRRVHHKGSRVPAADSSGLRIMSQVYWKCHVYVSDNSTSPTFEATLNAARGMLNWNKVHAATDFRQLVALLVQTSLLAGIHTILAIGMFLMNGHPILYISHRSSLLWKLTTAGDRAELREALSLVAGSRNGSLEKILGIDHIVEKHLNYAETRDLDEPEVIEPLQWLLGDLVPGVNTTDWILAVNMLQTKSGNLVQPADMAVGYGVPLIRDAFTEINANHGVSATALYLAAHFDAEVLSLELTRSRAAGDAEKTARFCLEMARNCLAHSWPQLFSQLLEIRDSAHFLQEMHSELKRAALALDLFTWLPDATHGPAEEHNKQLSLRVVSEEVWAEGMNVSGRLDGGDYAPLLAELDEHTGGTHFIELYLKVIRRDHELRMRKPPTLEQRVLWRLEKRAELAYSALLHSLVVPTAYQRAPYLYATTRVPTHFNYGTLGALIATGIADAIAPTAAQVTLKTVDGERPAGPAWWTGKALDRYNASAACLQRLHSRLGLRHPSGRRLALQWRAMFLRALGLRLAYDGLLASLGADSDTDDFRELWPEAQAEFFARFCLLSCDAEPDPVLSPRANCMLPLHNMREFGAVFECAAREDFIADHCPL